MEAQQPLALPSLAPPSLATLSIKKKKKKLGRKKSALSDKMQEPSEAALEDAAEAADFEQSVKVSTLCTVLYRGWCLQLRIGAKLAVVCKAA